VNKAQLIETLSDRLGGRRAANEAVDAVIDTITRAVSSGERVAITGFGVFEKVARPARTGRNPRTGASVQIKKTSVPKFKAGQSFKDVVSGAKKLPAAAASAVGGSGRGSSSGTSTAKKSAGKKSASTSASARKSSAKKSSAKKSGSSSSKSAAARTLATKSPAKKAGTKRAAAKTLASKGTAKKSSGRAAKKS
jgi:DNA-binding protein HU-beta